MQIRVRVVAAVLAAALSAPAMAQQALQNFERQLEQIRRETRLLIDPDVPVEQRAVIDYGAYISEYFLAIDDIEQETHILRQSDLNAYLRVNVDGVHQFFLRGRAAYRDWNSGDDFDGEGDDLIGPQVERAIYRFDLGRYYEAYEGQELDWNLTVDAGRQLVHWANGLVLSQVLDGAVVTADYGDWRLQALGGRTWEEQADLDASRPDFEDEVNRDWAGGMLSYAVTPRHRPFVYGLVQEDENDFSAYEYNSYYIGVGSTGAFTDRLLYGVEVVYEGGDTRSNILGLNQTRDDIEAWAADVRLDYLFADEAKSRITGEVVLASGDDDRAFHTTNVFGGNQAGTEDEAFNAFGLINTGLAFSPNVSNLILIRLGASTYPLHHTKWFDRLQVGVDLFLYNKMDSDAPSDEFTSDDRYLGFETDVYANWQVTSDVAVTARYGVFFPGEAVLTENDPRHFFFSGVTVGF